MILILLLCACSVSGQIQIVPSSFPSDGSPLAVNQSAFIRSLNQTLFINAKYAPFLFLFSFLFSKLPLLHNSLTVNGDLLVQSPWFVNASVVVTGTLTLGAFGETTFVQGRAPIAARALNPEAAALTVVLTERPMMASPLQVQVFLRETSSDTAPAFSLVRPERNFSETCYTFDLGSIAPLTGTTLYSREIFATFPYTENCPISKGALGAAIFFPILAAALIALAIYAVLHHKKVEAEIHAELAEMK